MTLRELMERLEIIWNERPECRDWKTYLDFDLFDSVFPVEDVMLHTVTWERGNFKGILLCNVDRSKIIQSEAE